MFAEILARFAAEHVCNLKEVKTPQSTLCSDLVSFYLFICFFYIVWAIRLTACFIYYLQDDPYLATTPGETMWSSRGSSDPRGVSVRARLWTSSMLRTIKTAALIPHPVLRLPDGGNWESMSPRVYRNIDEIFAGDCEGMTPDEVAVAHPQATTLRKMDKIGYRYPRGE